MRVLSSFQSGFFSSDFDAAFAKTDVAPTAAADATLTDANIGDPPTTTTAIATQPLPPCRTQLRHVRCSVA